MNVSNISFKGLTKTNRIADQQIGGTCWLEALENIIQLDNPYLPNDFSETLRQKMIEDQYPGYNQQTDNVDNAYIRYPEILRACGIESEWHNFDHSFIYNMLFQNRGVLLVGDVKYFPSYYHGQTGWHAIVLTDTQVENNKLYYYYGIDSNFKNETCKWGCQDIEEFAKSYNNKFKYPPVLITRNAMRWPHKNT